jgi:hypothetical protein
LSNGLDEDLVRKLINAPSDEWVRNTSERVVVTMTTTRSEIMFKCSHLLEEMKRQTEKVWFRNFALLIFDVLNEHTVQVLSLDDKKVVWAWVVLYKHKSPTSLVARVNRLIDGLAKVDGRSEQTTWMKSVDQCFNNQSALTYNTKRIELFVNTTPKLTKAYSKFLRQCANAEQIFLRDLDDHNQAKSRALVREQQRVKTAWEDPSKVSDPKAWMTKFAEEIAPLWSTIYGPNVKFPEIGDAEDTIPFRRSV